MDLTDEQKRSILARQASLPRVTFFDILGVSAEADKREVRRAYFKLSKEYHPDRFYGKNLGSFRDRLAEIFDWATRAFEVLSDDRRKAAYLEELAMSTGAGAGAAARPQSAGEQAAALFERACQRHVNGELEMALTELDAAARLAPQARYLCRAAEVALQAVKLSLAEKYATKAAEIDRGNAQAHRVLGKVLKAVGRLPEARWELETARKLDPENRHIAAELEELTKSAGDL